MVQKYDVHAADADLQWSAALPFDANDRATGAAGAAAVVTIAAQAGRPINLTQIHCSYTAAPAGGQVQVKDGTTVVFEQVLAGAGPFTFNFNPPRSGTAGNAMTITLAAPGGAIVGELDVSAHTLN